MFTPCTAKLLRCACRATLRPLSIPILFDIGTACTNMAGCASSWTTVRVEISPKSLSLPRGEMLLVVQLRCRDGLSKHDPNTYRDRNSSKQKESKKQEGLPTASRFLNTFAWQVHSCNILQHLATSCNPTCPKEGISRGPPSQEKPAPAGRASFALDYSSPFSAEIYSCHLAQRLGVSALISFH